MDTFDIAKLNLEPGDILVVRPRHPVPREVAESIMVGVKKVVGFEQRVLVLDSVDLAVLKRHEMEAMG